MSMTAIKSFATFSLCKNKDLLQLDLVYIRPVLSDWITLKKQISNQILLAAWYLKSESSFPPTLQKY